uniref:Uncharacterized protein n=1 Tax=Rheinheimera sp. BAL341 TaxID=1708203 RepID=A0A486XPJ2_9GAMM
MPDSEGESMLLLLSPLSWLGRLTLRFSRPKALRYDLTTNSTGNE